MMESPLEDMINFLQMFEWIYNFKLTNFFIDKVWEKIPCEWVNCLLSLTDEELNELPYGKVKEAWPESFKEFLNTAISFSLSRSHKSTLRTADIDPVLKKGMNPKKQHEVMKMAALVHDLALKTDCDVIVDVGSGLGYLGQTINKQYNHTVIGIEGKQSHTSGADKRITSIDGVSNVTCQLENATESMDKFQRIIMEVMASKIDNQPNRSCKICGKRERTMLNSNPKYCDKQEITTMLSSSKNCDKREITTIISSPKYYDENTRDLSCTERRKSDPNHIQPQNSMPENRSTLKCCHCEHKSCFTDIIHADCKIIQTDISCCHSNIKSDKVCVQESSFTDDHINNCDNIQTNKNGSHKNVKNDKVSGCHENICDCHSIHLSEAASCHGNIESEIMDDKTCAYSSGDSLNTMVDQDHMGGHHVCSNVPNILMVGLHCCGDLTPTMLRYFTELKYIRGLCCVSCCYHRMTFDETDGKFGNFPMSATLKTVLENKQNWSLTLYAMRLGAQETRARWKTQSSEDHDYHKKNVAYRGILEVFCKQEVCDGNKLFRKLTRKGDMASFDSYVDAVIHRTKLADIHDDVNIEMVKEKLQKIYSQTEKYFTYIEPFTALQVIVQPVIEALINIDRQTWNQEQGYQTTIVPVFDSHISPRNLALVATKNKI